MVVGFGWVAGVAAASAPAGSEGVPDSFHRFADQMIARLPYILAALCCVALTVLAARLVRRGVDASFRRSHREPHVRVIVDRLAFLATVIIGGVVSLAVLGVNLAVLVGSLGLLTIALGFALQAVTGNFVAGIVLLLEHPFTTGDYIVSQSAEGTVEDVRIRATRLRTADGQAVTVPSLLLFTNAVTNSSATPRRRLDVDLTVPPGGDVVAAREALAETARASPTVPGGPPAQVLTRDLGIDGTRVALRLWVDPRRTDFDLVRSTALERAEAALRLTGPADGAAAFAGDPR